MEQNPGPGSGGKQGQYPGFAKSRNTLMQKGLTVMNSIGEEFDVEKHEAITELEVPADKKEGSG